MEILEWIERWYLTQCDGDWEHNYGLKIKTLDNPGWDIEIDLTDTELENLNFPWKLIQKDENDWYGIKAENSIFTAAGDPQKLEFLLNKFKEIAEKK